MSYKIYMDIKSLEKSELKKKIKEFFDPQEDEPLSSWLLYHKPHSVLCVEFEMALPEHIKKEDKIAYNPHVGEPYLSDLIKMIEEALLESIWKNNVHLYSIKAQKYYSKNPGITMELVPMEQVDGYTQKENFVLLPVGEHEFKKQKS